MHWKTKRKLEGADRVYLTTQDRNTDLAYQARIKLPSNEYLLIELHQPFPNQPNYQSLAHGELNYDPENDPPMTHFSKLQTKRILNASKNNRENSAKTIDVLVSLIRNFKD